MRAAVYVRISKDDEGDRAGVERQREDCVAECERRGWEPVIFEDNDISASTRSKKARPGYRAMLAAVRAGEVGAIVAYDGSRLHRRPAELEEFITLIEAAKVPVVQVRGGSYDFGSADDRFKARVIGNAAALEAEKTGERVARQKLEGAKQGRPNSGGIRPWGFEDDHITHHPVEAEQVRQAARDLLAGKSLVTVSREAGKAPATIRAALKSPRMVGRRAYRGQEFEGSWEPILDLDTWQAVKAVLAARKKATREPGGERGRKYLLTGWARCGVCGAKAHGIPNKGRPGYQCVMACVRRQADYLDAFVREWVLERADLKLERPGVDPTYAAAVNGLEALLADLDEANLDPATALPAAVYAKQRAALEARLVGAQATLDAAVAEGEVWLGSEHLERGERYAENRAWWEAADLRQRRQLVERHAKAVIIRPQRRGPGFDPACVEIVPVG